MTAREIVKALHADGWQLVKGAKGGHRHFKHAVKPGRVTVPMHPGDVSFIVVKAIERQSGLKLGR